MFVMQTLSLDELRATPEKLEPLLNEGQTVTVTKDGKPYFDAVPPRPRRVQEFEQKIGELWAGSGRDRSPEEIVALIRKSRGDDRVL